MKIKYLIPGLLLVATLSGQTVPRPAGDFSVLLPTGKRVSLADYKGKVIILAGLLTTCTHCQATTGVLTGIQNQYAAKGVQVIGGTIDEHGTIPTKEFVAKYKPSFPVGESEHMKFMQFGQWSPMVRTFVPFMFFIDRKGQIRAQYQGSDPFYQQETANIVKMLDSLIQEGGGPASATPKPATKAPAKAASPTPAKKAS